MRRLPALVMSGLLLAGCTATSEGDGVDDESTTTAAGVATTLAEEPDDEALTSDGALALALGWINGKSLSEQDYERYFDEDFRTAISFDEFESVRAELAGDGPWSLGAPVDLPDLPPTVGAWEITSANGGPGAWIVLGVGDSGAISTLLVQPIPEFVEPAGTEAAIERLQGLGRLRLLVADVSDGSCVPLLDEAADEVMPLGSVFKLYVLGAVVRSIQSGSITWDTPVVIDDALDSLPSGTTQDVEPGTELTVRELAFLMISISDNTATDHLIELVGREGVEDALGPMGNDAIGANRPFLTTREMFIIKWGIDGLAERYVEADESDRRELLATEVAEADLPEVFEIELATPILVELLEWFASPEAICEAWLFLAGDPDALAILSDNPGVPGPAGTWTEIAFKGGSEPGVLALAWLVEDADGGRYVVVGGLSNASEAIDEAEAVNLFAFIRDRTPSSD